MTNPVRYCHWLVLIVAVQACGGDGGAPPAGSQATGVFANRVIDYSPIIPPGVTESTWPFFFEPADIIGAPGDFTSVVSLGYDPMATNAQGGSITVGLGDPSDMGEHSCIVDGPGSDFAVFENPFRTGDIGDGTPGTFNEIATVEVSDDGERWFRFPPGEDALKELIDPARYTNFAGVIPLGEGGDQFDLAEVILANPGAIDATFRACFVRISDGGTRYQDYGNTQSDLTSSGSDLNAVEAFNFETVKGLKL